MLLRLNETVLSDVISVGIHRNSSNRVRVATEYDSPLQWNYDGSIYPNIKWLHEAPEDSHGVYFHRRSAVLQCAITSRPFSSGGGLSTSYLHTRIHGKSCTTRIEASVSCSTIRICYRMSSMASAVTSQAGYSGYLHSSY